MFCTKCGQGNAEGAAFCSQCGHPLLVVNPPEAPQQPMETAAPATPYGQVGGYPPQQVPYPPQQSPYPPQGYAPYAPSKKKGSGLVIGLVLGGCSLLLVIAALLLFIWPGWLLQTSVVGLWYNDSLGEVLEFNNNGEMCLYTYEHEYRGEYDYDNAQGKGVISLYGDTYTYTASPDVVYVEGIGFFNKADAQFNIEDFRAKIAADYDTEDLFSEASEDTFSDVSEGGDIDDIAGLWYDVTGYYGTIYFFSDGTYYMDFMGILQDGTYTYDPYTMTGAMTDSITKETAEFSYNNGELQIDSTLNYTRDYVEQYDYSADDSDTGDVFEGFNA